MNIASSPALVSQPKTVPRIFCGTKLKDQHYEQSPFVSLALAGLFVIPTITHAQFAGSVVAYTEGSGVLPGYNDPTAALGAPSQVTPGDLWRTG